MVSAAVVSLLLASCGVKTTTRVPVVQQRPAKTATRGELVEAYNRQARAVRSINAAVELNPVAGGNYSGVIEDYHDVKGFILAERPAFVRMIGQAPVVNKTVFDMASDGAEFRIFIPPKNKFIVGPADFERAGKSAIENLRPQHLVDALFWMEIPPARTVLFEEFDQSPDHFYVLTLLSESGSEIEKKVWFDRSDLSIARAQTYGAQGRLDSDVRYGEWQPAGAGAEAIYPRHIRMLRPHEDYQLEIRIQRLTLNQEIAPDRFRLEQPAGTELVKVGLATGEKPQ